MASEDRVEERRFLRTLQHEKNERETQEAITKVKDWSIEQRRVFHFKIKFILCLLPLIL